MIMQISFSKLIFYYRIYLLTDFQNVSRSNLRSYFDHITNTKKIYSSRPIVKNSLISNIDYQTSDGYKIMTVYSSSISSDCKVPPRRVSSHSNRI